LQYAAFANIRNLLEQQTTTLKPLFLLRSLQQWWKWLNNRSPD
jgi:hypothetical protein